MPANVIFRDAKGRFVAQSQRYTAKVKSVQVRRRGEYHTVIEAGNVTPEKLAQVTNRTEFESFKEAVRLIREIKSPANVKYKAWQAAEQIDKTPGIRRKLIKVTMNILEGNSLKKVYFYHNMRSNQKRSYQLFRRMNDTLGLEGFYLYDRVGNRVIGGRTGAKVTLKSVTLEQVI